MSFLWIVGIYGVDYWCGCVGVGLVGGVFFGIDVDCSGCFGCGWWCLVGYWDVWLGWDYWYLKEFGICV